jgi:hypothetical protein
LKESELCETVRGYKGNTARFRQEKKMAQFKITLEVSEDYLNPVAWSAEILESALRDLLTTSLLPSLNLNLTESTVTKRRG